MEEGQKLDYILANMVKKEDISNLVTKGDITDLATKDSLAEMKSDILLEIDRQQRMLGKHFDCLEEQVNSLQDTREMMELIYIHVNYLRKSYIDLQSRIEMMNLKLK